MIKTLEESFKINIQKSNNKQRKSSLTDEKMIATAYWIAMYSNIRPVLVSGDKDFSRLLGISSDIFRRVNDDFRRMLDERPPKLYLVFGEYLDSVIVKGITLSHARKGQRKEMNEEQKAGMYRNLEEISTAFVSS